MPTSTPVPSPPLPNLHPLYLYIAPTTPLYQATHHLPTTTPLPGNLEIGVRGGRGWNVRKCRYSSTLVYYCMRSAVDFQCTQVYRTSKEFCFSSVNLWEREGTSLNWSKCALLFSTELQINEIAYPVTLYLQEHFISFKNRIDKHWDNLLFCTDVANENKLRQ